ncbi:extracellular solute-binding protein [Burkholderia sp. SJ98]|nr:extracellular solute-binding protein [Burkholderia sp. SJ98]
MKEAAATFQKRTGITVNVTAGPTTGMERQARKDADIVYSGFETMKSNFLDAMSAQLTPSAAEPLYLRPAAILARPGNPKHIKRITDRLKLGVKVLVVNGSGQGEFEEDVAGRTEQILLMKALRDDIVEYSKNSALATQSWTEHPDIDFWLIWNIWQVANPSAC